jgi:hypothetical protein
VILLSLVITFFDEAMFLLHFNCFSFFFLSREDSQKEKALDVYKALGVERSVLVVGRGPLHKLVISHAKQLYLAEIPEEKTLHQVSSNSLASFSSWVGWVEWNVCCLDPPSTLQVCVSHTPCRKG